MTSRDQLNRIVTMVSQLTKSSLAGMESTTLGELAGRLGTGRSQVQSDIRTLTMVGDDPAADWLLSLTVWQEGDRVAIASGGPFQRPMRFTADELMAMQLGLSCLDQQETRLSAALAQLLNQAEPANHALPGRGRVSPSIANLARKAIGDRRKLEIRYTGAQSLAGTNRVVHPYQMMEQDGQEYLVAWCELAGGWRHFRLDRILDALDAGGYYVPRDDFAPARESFVEPDEPPIPVQVRFSPAVARWLRERHTDATEAPDGSLVVTYRVASPEWLVRHVLQYGPEAEVIGPDSFRQLMRRELA